MKKIFLLLISLTLMVSCLDEDLADGYENINEKEIIKYLEDNNLNGIKNEEFGYYYVIEKEGDGINPIDTNVVNASYTFSYTNGEVINQSDEGVDFVLQNLIFGLRVGLTHFSKGSSGKIIIPSRLAFLDSKVVVFEIKELLNIYADIDTFNDVQIYDYIVENNLSDNAIETESGLYYIIDEEGTGEQPTSTDNVTVAYKGYFLNGGTFDQSTAGVSFNLQGVIQGWTEGITYFKEGGSGKLFIPSRLAYGSTGNNSIPPNSVLIFDINLISVN